MAGFLSERAKFTDWTIDRLRIADIDFQGHVNNSVHPVLYTSGRHEFIQRHVRPRVAQTDMFALVKVTIEYLNEMRYPGEVEVGPAQAFGTQLDHAGTGNVQRGPLCLRRGIGNGAARSGHTAREAVARGDSGTACVSGSGRRARVKSPVCLSISHGSSMLIMRNLKSRGISLTMFPIRV